MTKKQTSKPSSETPKELAPEKQVQEPSAVQNPGFFTRLRRRWKMILGVLLLVAIGVFFFRNGNGSQQMELYSVERSTLQQVVSVTGLVQASQAVELGFEQSGKVAEVLVEVGDRVSAGQELVILDNKELNAQLLQADANIQTAQAQYQARLAELETAKSEVTSAQAGVENEEAQLVQLQSALEEAQQQLAETKRGTRREEIQIAQTTVSNRENEVTDLEKELENVLQQADQELAGLLEEGRDQIADAAATGRAVLSENLLEIIYPIRTPSNKTCTVQINAFVEFPRDSCIDALDAMDQLEERRIILLETDGIVDVVIGELKYTKSALEKVRILVLESLKLADGAISPNGGNSFSFTTSDSSALKTPITNGRNILEAGLQSITSITQQIENQIVSNQSTIDAAQNKLNRAKDALVSAEADLELKIAGSTPEQIAAAEAKVRQAEANLTSQQARIKQAQTAPSAQQARIDLAQANVNAQAAQIKREQANKSNIQAQIEKTIITAPFDGVVTKQEADIGEIVAANSIIVGLISDTEFEIEANIPEVDIAKISVDDVASISLDAYGPEEIFEARVARIDPAETIIDDVTNYQVVFRFAERDERIRSGMTANIELLTHEWPDVLSVPEFTLIREGGEVFVTQLVGEDPREENALETTPVSIGPRSSDGFRIIEEGLEEGDTVVHIFED